MNGFLPARSAMYLARHLLSMFMNLSDLVGMTVTVWILNQAQESITPGGKFEGVLRGVDQGAYIFETGTPGSGTYVILPVGSCRLQSNP